MCRSTGATGLTRRSFGPCPTFRTSIWRCCSDYGRALYHNTDYAILGWGFGVCFLGLSLITDRTSNVTQGLTDEWMMMLMTEKETCHEMMDRSVEATIQCLKLVHEAVGDYVFAWGIAADDSGTQRGRVRPAGTVGRDAEAALQEAVRLDSCPHTLEGLPPLLRLDLPPDPAFHRGRHRHPQSRADIGRQHGPGAAEAAVRRPAGVLGRRLRHAARARQRARRRRFAST